MASTDIVHVTQVTQGSAPPNLDAEVASGTIWVRWAVLKVPLGQQAAKQLPITANGLGKGGEGRGGKRGRRGEREGEGESI